MLATDAESVEVTITRRSLERISDWLAGELRLQARSALIAVPFKAALSLISVAALFLFLMFVIYPIGAAVATPVIFAVALGIEFAMRSRRRGFIRVHGVRLTYSDEKGQLDDPNRDEDTFHKLALFPAWLLFAAYDSVIAAARLRSARPAECAELLAFLVVEGRTVYPRAIEEQFGPEIIPALKTMLVFTGVLVTNRDTPGLILSTDLREKIGSML